jgi:hypothetical protein
MGNMRNAQKKIWSENVKGRDHSENPSIDGKVILEWILGKLHLVPMSRMHGAITTLLQYAFIARCSVKKSTETALPLPYLRVRKFGLDASGSG